MKTKTPEKPMNSIKLLRPNEAKPKPKVVKNPKRARNIFVFIFALIVAGGVYFYYKNWITSIIALIVTLIVIPLAIYFMGALNASARIKKMEDSFPDFLQLVSNNLRAGMTISEAMLLSAREEFDPLDKEISRVGKDIATGIEIEVALQQMAKRINSPKISKTILLIISGIKSGGNMAVLLEETSSNMRERGFIEKRAGSNVLMYVIFIFIAVAIAAPLLFALSNTMVEVMTGILEDLPAVSTESSTAKMPFTLSSVSISTTFVLYFSLIFMLMTDILGALILGLVSRGEEREGLRYLIPILFLSYGTFFLTKVLLGTFLSGFF